MNDHQYIAFFAVIVAFLFFLGSSLSSQNFISGQQEEPGQPLEESACSDIGGWDAVGDVVACVSDTLSTYSEFFGIRVSSSLIQNLFITPLVIGLGLIFVSIIRGGS